MTEVVPPIPPKKKISLNQLQTEINHSPQVAGTDDAEKMVAASQIQEHTTYRPKVETPVTQKLELEPPIESYDYHDHHFDQTETVKLNQGIVADQGAKFRDLISVWNWKMDNGEHKHIPVPARWHPHSVIKRIINHNKLGQYTGIVMIGQLSGDLLDRHAS